MLEIMINEEVIEIEYAAPSTMLLSYLRDQLGLTGSKEGCASGDCGACTVIMIDLHAHSGLRFSQINACITPLNALHAKHIVTVEHLNKNGALHPVQQLVVDKHGSQCGFCTPGIIMSLYALSKRQGNTDKPEDFLAGNLCRCTGYGPLIDAAKEIAGVQYYDPTLADEAAVTAWLSSCNAQTTHNYLKPTNRKQLAEARRAMPKASFIAGGTDLALEITQQLSDIEQIIDISQVDDLLSITELDHGWRIGAAVPLNQVHTFMREHFPSTDELISRLGSLTIRNRATLGGSLGHASPIGDIAPLLISLNGEIEVDDGETKRRHAPHEYITGYRQTLLEKQQWISGVYIPRLGKNQRHAIYKVSKRFEDDIATVVMAFNFRFDTQSRIESCSIAGGGIAAKSTRLSELEAHMLGKPFTQALVREVKALAALHIHPLSDVRGSANYRVSLVQNLIQRFYFECNNIPTRLSDHA
ncbi:xanthine dehydrogenase small subunit [Alginatibacterium sediminis]|uniref:Xanthine dehydrogenase small subunit n=1 Tax=Alginatibacterium sediminis TaxID=2164068 RepID=A0A420EGS0_9ALTE|nr:xanthine dehydrogenase small subunit [Alginatibacterium sediminis]RKF19889.1 xanthine dehydrogenase small subunit [Alginatibacterium sediminis]